MTALPHSYVWMDFISIPQTCDFDQDKDISQDSVSYFRKASSDTSEGAVLRKLQLAVDSIPAYVERSSLLLVLVPVCMHVDRHQMCNFSTWRQRGWCRLEFLAAFLKCGTLHVMICDGAESRPFFSAPMAAMFMQCGEGQFTCCQKNHFMNGTEIPCDKAKVRGVLETMIHHRMQYEETIGNILFMRQLLCLKHRFLFALPASGWAHLLSDGA